MYPFPPTDTCTSLILVSVPTSTTALPPVPSPTILTSKPSSPAFLYPVPPSSTNIFLIWLLLISEFPLSLTLAILLSVDVSQLLGNGINSVASNFIISLGGTVNKYFQRYPSSVAPVALNGSNPVNVGSFKDALPVVFIPDDPLSIQI